MVQKHIVKNDRDMILFYLKRNMKSSRKAINIADYSVLQVGMRGR